MESLAGLVRYYCVVVLRISVPVVLTALWYITDSSMTQHGEHTSEGTIDVHNTQYAGGGGYSDTLKAQVTQKWHVCHYSLSQPRTKWEEFSQSILHYTTIDWCHHKKDPKYHNCLFVQLFVRNNKRGRLIVWYCKLFVKKTFKLYCSHNTIGLRRETKANTCQPAVSIHHRARVPSLQLSHHY